MLFDAIFDFSHFTHDPTLLDSQNYLQTYTIEKMVNQYEIEPKKKSADVIVCFSCFPCNFNKK